MRIELTKQPLWLDWVNLHLHSRAHEAPPHTYTVRHWATSVNNPTVSEIQSGVLRDYKKRTIIYSNNRQTLRLAVIILRNKSFWGWMTDEPRQNLDIRTPNGVLPHHLISIFSKPRRNTAVRFRKSDIDPASPTSQRISCSFRLSS